MKNKKVLFIAQTAGIAAMYAALTYAQTCCCRAPPPRRCNSVCRKR